MGMGGGLVPVHRGTLILPGPDEATDRTWTKDRHKSPTSIPPFPLSLQAGANVSCNSPIRLSKFMKRREILRCAQNDNP